MQSDIDLTATKANRGRGRRPMGAACVALGVALCASALVVSQQAHATGDDCDTPTDRSAEYVISHGTLYGTNCADVITAVAGVKTYFGEGGNDRIIGSGSGERIYGGAGDDTAFGGRGGDKIFGGPGNDHLDGGTGDDYIYGNAGDDTLIGGPGADVVRGGGGNDLVRGGTTVDKLIGGPGINTISYADGVTPGFETDPEKGTSNPETRLVKGFPGKHGERGVYVNLSGRPAKIGDNGATARYGGGRDHIRGFQNVIGTPFDDLIIGSSAANVIDAGPGNDIVRGGGGDDRIYGGAGDDYLDGERGQQTASVHGGPGNDTCLHGGDGTSCESANPKRGIPPSSERQISVGLFEPDDPGFRPADLYVRGSVLPDDVTATWSPGNVHFTAEGVGTGRFDTADNGTSGCTVTATAADCPIEGADSIVISGGPGRDVLSAQQFPLDMSVTLLGGSAADTLIGGDESNDILVDGPGYGADTLEGNGGDDALFENAGRDVLDGGEGNDLFISSTVCDGDTIDGGPGSDNANWAQLVGPEIKPRNAGYPAWNQPVFEAAKHGVRAELANGNGRGTLSRQGKPCAKRGTIVGVENVEGSSAPDVLIGNNGPNGLLGRGGADVLEGRGGDDVLLANNRSRGFRDRDKKLDCGAGRDYLKMDPADAGLAKGCEKIVVGTGTESRVR